MTDRPGVGRWKKELTLTFKRSPIPSDCPHRPYTQPEKTSGVSGTDIDRVRPTPAFEVIRQERAGAANGNDPVTDATVPECARRRWSGAAGGSMRGSGTSYVHGRGGDAVRHVGR